MEEDDAVWVALNAPTCTRGLEESRVISCSSCVVYLSFHFISLHALRFRPIDRGGRAGQGYHEADAGIAVRPLCGQVDGQCGRLALSHIEPDLTINMPSSSSHPISCHVIALQTRRSSRQSRGRSHPTLSSTRTGNGLEGARKLPEAGGSRVTLLGFQWCRSSARYYGSTV